MHYSTEFLQNMLAKASSAEERETAERALEVAVVYEAYEKIVRNKKIV